MSFIKRSWTPAQADEWTKEDWITIVISPIIYILILVGTALSFLLIWYGFLILLAGISLTVLMHWIIDPKLQAVSGSYEKHQKEYIKQLERSVRWEDKDE